jgi:hypothetical protein
LFCTIKKAPGSLLSLGGKLSFPLLLFKVLFQIIPHHDLQMNGPKQEGVFFFAGHIYHEFKMSNLKTKSKELTYLFPQIRQKGKEKRTQVGGNLREMQKGKLLWELITHWQFI